VVTARFWPENAMSATRVTSYVEHLAARGHHVTVLTRRGPTSVDETAPRPSYRVIRVRDPIARIERHVSASAGSSRRLRSSRTAVRVRQRLMRGIAWPDRFSLWAMIAVVRLRAKPLDADVVVSSGPPLSAVLVGSLLARKAGAHHVVEFRDLISTGTYNDGGRARRWTERVLERRAVRSARALVTVSQPLARDLATIHDAPVTVVQNGFDDTVPVVPRAPQPDGSPLRLAFCGEIYVGRRDPSPLFAALRELDETGVAVTVDFYGNTSEVLRGLVREHGVEDMVSLHDRVSHADSRRIQEESDVLLLLMWNDPREMGVYSGKLYEYIGARRPILMLGYVDGVAATLIRDRSAGIVANDSTDIGSALRHWADQKRTSGIPSLPGRAAVGLSRTDQAQVLEQLLVRVVDG